MVRLVQGYNQRTKQQRRRTCGPGVSSRWKDELGHYWQSSVGIRVNQKHSTRSRPMKKDLTELSHDELTIPICAARILALRFFTDKER